MSASANLANVYAELMRRCGESYTITYGAPPTYLVSMVGAAEAGKKIVLVFKEDRNGAVARLRTTPTRAAPKKRALRTWI